MARKVFKKNLTPLSKKGRIDTHVGKGATEQRTPPRVRETLTGGDTLARAADIYPKPPPPKPEGMGLRPTAGMPSMTPLKDEI